MVRGGVVFLGGGIIASVAAAALFATLPPSPPLPRPTPATTAAVHPAVPQKPAAIAPSFDVVKVAPDGSAVIAGRAAPGAHVKVLDGATELGAVTADRRGEWVLLPAKPLSPGDRQLRLEAQNPSGGTSKSTNSVALSIAPAPAAAGTGRTALAVALPEGAGAPKLLQRPDAAAGGLSLDAVEYDEKGGLVFSGHAAPGASLELYLGNRVLAPAKADASGAWSAAAPAAPAAGGQELRLDELAADGHVSRRVAMPLVKALALKPPANQDYVVEAGNNLWQIARRSYGSGLRYTIIYSANLQHIRNPDLIYPGQVFRLPRS